MIYLSGYTPANSYKKGIMGITEGDTYMSDDINSRIAEIEREIAILPEGSITKKSIKGKEYCGRKWAIKAGKYNDEVKG